MSLWLSELSSTRKILSPESEADFVVVRVAVSDTSCYRNTR